MVRRISHIAQDFDQACEALPIGVSCDAWGERR